MDGVLIAGGAGDPNLVALLDQARELGVRVIDMLLVRGQSPAFEWRLPGRVAMLDGAALDPSGAFLRYDVFSTIDEPRPEVARRAEGWFTAVHSWACAGSIDILNRGLSHDSHLKPAVLALAHQVGLAVPATWITNSARTLSGLSDSLPWIAKPVAGGDYCRLVQDPKAFGAGVPDGPMPAIVQPRLDAPELRIYIVRDFTASFEIRSDSVDYRELQDATLSHVETPALVEAPLRRLMAKLGMDFGAADFRRDPQTGAWTFLELNTSPMFARFDEECGGLIGRAILRALSNAQTQDRE